MIKTNLNWTVKNLKAMHDSKETLSFNHPIQRISGQWDNEQQSLLIHSLLANYPVPSVYIHKMESIEVDGKGKHPYSYSVLDGKQRMTTVFSYINGEFALSEDVPDVIIEGASYEIAGKYFADLADDVQQEVLRFRFNITCFEDVTDEEIEEIFFRLNNSTPLTKAQKSKPLMGVENSVFVNELLTKRFFTEKCSFSKMQLRKSDDMCTLLQAMLLLDNKYRGYQFDTISQDEVMKYSQYIKNNYPSECKERVKKIIGFLDNAFYMKDKNLKKINIPIIFLMADLALEKSISNFHFRMWYNDFFDKHKEEYNQFCSSGSIKKEKTLGRISVMSKYFEEYFRQDAEENKDAEPAEIEQEKLATEEMVGNEVSTESVIESEVSEESDNEADAESHITAESTEDGSENEQSVLPEQDTANEPESSPVEQTADDPTETECLENTESIDTTTSDTTGTGSIKTEELENAESTSFEANVSESSEVENSESNDSTISEMQEDTNSIDSNDIVESETQEDIGSVDYSKTDSTKSKSEIITGTDDSPEPEQFSESSNITSEAEQENSETAIQLLNESENDSSTSESVVEISDAENSESPDVQDTQNIGNKSKNKQMGPN